MKVVDIPHIDTTERIEAENLGNDFHRVSLLYGFMGEIDIPRDLYGLGSEPFLRMYSNCLLGRPAAPSPQNDRPGMALWQENHFAWMLRNSEGAMEFFKLPTNRVIQLRVCLESQG